MRLQIILLLCAGTLLAAGCASHTQGQTSAVQSSEASFSSMSAQSSDGGQSAAASGESGAESSSTQAPDAGKSDSQLDDTAYLGEYLDSDTEEPNLEIARGDEGKYLVQIGIYRLTSLSDGLGTLTSAGMEFTATDAAGNPISGIITFAEQTATVTFTDSTWEYLPNGSTFLYTKFSDTPNIWQEP